MKVLAVFSPDDILPYIRRGKKHKHPFYDDEGNEWQVNVTSRRYHVFAKNRKCVICGIEGTEMRLEKEDVADDSITPHFNLDNGPGHTDQAFFKA